MEPVSARQSNARDEGGRGSAPRPRSTLELNAFRSTARYSAVLLHAVADARGDTLVRDAVVLANAFGARLLGVSTPSVCGAGAGAADLDAFADQAVHILMDAAGERFREATTRVHAGSFWRKMNAPPPAALAALSWAADLLMVDGGPQEGGTLETVLKRTGRAVLVRNNPARALGLQRALILWDDSAACARAVSAALPLLGKADQITVLASRAGRQAAEALADLERGLKIRNLPVCVLPEGLADRPGREAEVIGGFQPDVVVMSGRARWGRPSPLRLLAKLDAYALVSL